MPRARRQPLSGTRTRLHFAGDCQAIWSVLQLIAHMRAGAGVPLSVVLSNDAVTRHFAVSPGPERQFGNCHRHESRALVRSVSRQRSCPAGGAGRLSASLHKGIRPERMRMQLLLLRGREIRPTAIYVCTGRSESRERHFCAGQRLKCRRRNRHLAREISRWPAPPSHNCRPRAFLGKRATDSARLP